MLNENVIFLCTKLKIYKSKIRKKLSFKLTKLTKMWFEHLFMKKTVLSLTLSVLDN